MTFEQKIYQTLDKRELFEGLEKRIGVTSPEDFTVIFSYGETPYNVEKPLGDTYELRLSTFTLRVSSTTPSFGVGVQYFLRVFEERECVVAFVEDSRDRQELHAYQVRALYEKITTKIKVMQERQKQSILDKQKIDAQQRKQDVLQRLVHVLETDCSPSSS